MVVLKSINNNIVSAIDDNGKEVVLMGKGIGYNAKQGQIIDSSSVQKIFNMTSQANTDKLKELFFYITQEDVEIANDIIEYAHTTLARRLNENIYITLTDHISFAIKRFRSGMSFHNALLAEIKSFYGKEYNIGVYALKLINEKTGLQLPEDEAASIALHLVNAQYDVSISEAFATTKLIEKIINITDSELNYSKQEQSFPYERFLAHIKYLALKVIKTTSENTLPDDEEIFDIVYKNYPDYIEKTSKVEDYLKTNHSYNLSKEEKAYLALHFRRLSR